jgi:MOSC domain-containing protein YiiM
MITSLSRGSVVAVCKKARPGLPKLEAAAIQLLENYGVEGDYHAGEFIRHRYLAKKDPTKLLLIDTTILAELASQDIDLEPGMTGENIIVDGISVMSLAIGTRVEVGEGLLEITEVRNPCYQLNEMHPRLLKAAETSGTKPDPRNAGMMARILKGGWVRPGDTVTVLLQSKVK